MFMVDLQIWFVPYIILGASLRDIKGIAFSNLCLPALSPEDSLLTQKPKCLLEEDSECAILQAEWWRKVMNPGGSQFNEFCFPIVSIQIWYCFVIKTGSASTESCFSHFELPFPYIPEIEQLNVCLEKEGNKRESTVLPKVHWDSCSSISLQKYHELSFLAEREVSALWTG